MMEMHIRDIQDCQGQSVNPDISGIGVRLSFYLQNALLAILVNRSWQDASGALWTMIFTSFALTISAVVQSGQQQLSLFQAITVTNLVWLANFGTFVSVASYSRNKASAERKEEASEGRVEEALEREPRPKTIRTSVSKIQYFAAIQTWLSGALTLFVWANADTFGNQDDCAPSVKYVAFFAANFPALTSGRILGLTVTGILVIVHLLVTIHEIHIHMQRLRKARQHTEHDTENPAQASFSLSPLPAQFPLLQVTPPSRSQTVSDDGPFPTRMPEPTPTPRADLQALPSPSLSHHSRSDSSHSKMSSLSRKEDKRDKRHRPLGVSASLDPMFLSLMIVHSVIILYFVVTTELLLQRNPAADNSAGQWGFGQIFALILIGPSVVPVYEALRERGFSRQHHWTQKSHKKQARRRSHCQLDQ